MEIGEIYISSKQDLIGKLKTIKSVCVEGAFGFEYYQLECISSSDPRFKVGDTIYSSDDETWTKL